MGDCRLTELWDHTAALLVCKGEHRVPAQGSTCFQKELNMLLCKMHENNI